MAAIYHNGDWYGLGSDVVANPQGSATDTLTKVGIDGTIYEVTDADAVHTSDIGTANGVAELDANGLVPSSQLPSYVDDVLEYASVSAFPATGETGKIYVALDTNLTYRWSGSAYVEISPSLALGETSSTAYRGDRGKTAYDHATESGRSGAKSAGLYKIGVTAQGHVASATAVAKADLTALGVADQNDVDAIEEDIEGYKTVTGKYITVTDAAELPAESYSLTLSPVQDLNGYDSPWVGGAGKNKLPLSVSAIKAANTSGTWNGNTYTLSDIAFTVLTNDIGEVVGIRANGTTTARRQFIISSGTIKAGSYILNGCPSGGSGGTYQMFIQAGSYFVDVGSGVNISLAADTAFGGFIDIQSGVTIDKIFYPMLRLSTVTDSTFAPYSNICPIHGADEVGVRVCGKNLLENTYEGGGIVTVNSDKSVTVNGTLQNTAWLPINTNVTLEPGTYILSGTPSNAPSNSYVYDNNSFGGWTSQAGQEATLTLTEKKTGSIYIRLNGSGTVYNNVTFKPMIRPASVTDSTYEQYTATDTTITLPSTVYGGSVDLTTGVLTVTHEIVSFDSFTGWNEYNGAYYKGFSGYKKGTSGIVNVSNKLRYGGQNTGIGSLINQGRGCFGFRYDANDHIQIYPPEDLTDFFPVTIAYELAEPFTIQLTPFPQTLLEGVNNLWAEMVENSTVIDNAQQSLSYQPQNIVGQLRQEINAKPDSFAQLSDTAFSNLANGQIPKWNSTSQKWENANESGGGGASSLADLSDTNISSPADGQILKWDNATSKWVNAAEYSYTLPTASASTKGGIKVGDNLSMNGEVLSAKLPQWTKIWNYNSGATFSMPSGKTDIMLVIMVSILVDNRAMSNVYPVEYPFSASLVCSFDLDGTVLGGGTLAINVSTANTVTITNTSQLPSQNVDFEIWVR